MCLNTVAMSNCTLKFLYLAWLSLIGNEEFAEHTSPSIAELLKT